MLADFVYKGDASPDLHSGFGASILRKEAEALLSLADRLDGEFSRCIECLYNTPGRIAVTGMGKSGLVGRKISATLSSTGSPSFFIHPAEASHGDMGMLAAGDAMLALSWSGNTSELANIITYVKEQGIPLIAMTGRRDSLLGRYADYHMIMPKIAEADTLECAPTTSTTMQMALGDAIAVTLMRKRGIEIADFHKWHPGGTLGRKLYLVRDLMHTGGQMPLLSPDTLMSEALVTMSAKGFGIIGVEEKGKLVGVITDGDLRRHMHPLLLDKKAEDVMTKTPLTLDENKLVAEALQLMQSRKITALFVESNGKPVGIVHIHDLIHAIPA